MIKTKWDYTVTWESNKTGPITVQGQVECISYKSAVGKSIRDAAKQKGKKSSYQTIVLVLEKHVDEPEPTVPQEAPPEPVESTIF